MTCGCLWAQEREKPVANLSLDRIDPGEWSGRVPNPGKTNLGRTNSIKGTQVIDPETYVLTIGGAVDNAITVGLKEILERPYVERRNVMYCVEGWSWSADWVGIAVRDILGEVRPWPTARRVIFYAADGYTSSFPIEELNGSDLFILAYKANGEFLPEKEGYPVRLVAEGKWGYKWVKWVVKMEVSENADHRGYWETRGYSDEADVK